MFWEGFMKRLPALISAALGAALLTIAAPGAQEAGADRAYPIATQEAVGPWTLIAANDPGGAFHHCELSREQGDYEITFLRGTAGYVLVVVNPGWQLPDGATYVIGLEGSGLDRVDYQASTASTGIIVLLGEDWDLVGKLRDVGTLRLSTAQSAIPLPMDAAATGFERLEACWTQRIGASSNPFVPMDTGASERNPFEAADMPAEEMAGNPASGADGLTVSLAGVEASGANFSDAEIGAMFRGDFGKLAALSADRVLVPQITATFAGPEGAAPFDVVYRDVSFSGIAGGQADGADIGSMELRSGDVGIVFDHVSTGRLDIDGLLAFYGLVPFDPRQDAPQLLYEDFAVDGVRISLPGAQCDLGPVEAAEFSGRPLHVTPVEALRIVRDVRREDGAPAPEAIARFARLYADYLTAFRSGPFKISNIDCSAENTSGQAITLTADSFGMEGLEPNRLPGIDARNLKLGVEGEGVFAARALILKPADVTAVVSTLRQAGNHPDPAWLADNARALIPAFEGVQMAGVTLDVPDADAPGQRLRIGLADANLALGDYRDGIPSDVRMTAFGIAIPMSDEDMQPLADMGYSVLDLGVTLASHWDLAAGTIDIDRLVLSGQDMGSIALAAALTGATPDLVSGDNARVLGALLSLGVESIGLTLEDQGLRDRLIAAGAKSAGLDAETFATQLARLAQTYVPQGRDWSEDVTAAASAFVRGAPSITLELSADMPVAAAQVLSAQSDPASLLDLFAVRASGAP